MTQAEFQVTSLQKQVTNSAELLEKLSNANALAIPGQEGQGNGRVDLDMQLQFLKDQLAEERKMREAGLQDTHRLRQEMTESLRHME